MKLPLGYDKILLCRKNGEELVIGLQSLKELIEKEDYNVVFCGDQYLKDGMNLIQV